MTGAHFLHFHVKVCVHDWKPKNESKINENDDDMLLEPITRVAVQMDHG